MYVYIYQTWSDSNGIVHIMLSLPRNCCLSDATYAINDDDDDDDDDDIKFEDIDNDNGLIGNW